MLPSRQRTRSAPRNSTRFAARYPARGLPCERFTAALASRNLVHHSGPGRLARPYPVEDLHLLSFASFPGALANGSSREFYYQRPRLGMLEAGAHPDSLLFSGQINNGQFSGTAYVFNAQCGQVPFEVKGPILENGGRVALTGQAPRVGRNCQASGYYTSTLEFRLLKSTEVAQPAQPSKTAQAPDVEEPKPEVPLSDVGEPKLPGAPSAPPPATAQTPSIRQSSGFGEPKQPSNTPVQPSPTT